MLILWVVKEPGVILNQPACICLPLKGVIRLNFMARDFMARVYTLRLDNLTAENEQSSARRTIWLIFSCMSSRWEAGSWSLIWLASSLSLRGRHSLHHILSIQSFSQLWSIQTDLLSIIIDTVIALSKHFPDKKNEKSAFFWKKVSFTGDRENGILCCWKSFLIEMNWNTPKWTQIHGN